MRTLVTALLLGSLTPVVLATESTPFKIDFGLFVDTYYAFDANQPANRERALTTVPARHNEFAVNLAYVDARAVADHLRGRLALQAGTSVVANYSSESRDPAKTGVQLADVLMLLQEAYAGYRLGEGLWLDAGIFFSHIGMESFLSRDNWTYTRSLVADFSPYYQAGVKVSYDLTPQWSAQLHVVNGWQNVVETNHEKSLGTQVIFHPNDRFSVSHNTLIGRESEFRVFQDLILKLTLLHWWESALTLDLGFQKRKGATGYASWYGGSWQNRFRLGERTFLATRLEYYSDKEGIIAPTGTGGNLQAWGASVNIDQHLLPQLLWRNELRYLRATDPVFPSSSGRAVDTLLGITSLALTL